MLATSILACFSIAKVHGELPADVRVHAESLAVCAAYYFNATNAKPMAEYERYFAAGERSRNRARRYLEPRVVDRLMAEASTAMTALTGGDWRQFHRVDARYADDCVALDAARRGTAPGIHE